MRVSTPRDVVVAPSGGMGRSGCFLAYRIGAMQAPANGLPRTHLPRTTVNRARRWSVVAATCADATHRTRPAGTVAPNEGASGRKEKDVDGRTNREMAERAFRDWQEGTGYITDMLDE